MYKFSSYLTRLNEASLDDIRSEMINLVKTSDNKELVTMYRSMGRSLEKRVIKKKLAELFKARNMEKFISTVVFDEFLNKILSTKHEVDVKVEFVEGMIAGDLFDSRKFISSKSGDLKNFTKLNNPVMKDLYTWFVDWVPNIESNSTVTVGAAEAFMIFNSVGGGKGDPAGDVKIGSNLIEVKTGGGTIGKDGSKVWGGSQDLFISMAQKEAPALKSLKRAEILKMIPLAYTKTKEKSFALNKMSGALKLAGKSDAEISAFWEKYINTALKTKIPKFISTRDGVTNYDDWHRFATAAAMDQYKEKSKFTMLTLLDKKTGAFLNFTTGADMLKTKDWYFDQSLTWTGGGQGGGLSGRISNGNKIAPTYASAENLKQIEDQYKSIKVFATRVVAISKSKKKNFAATDKMIASLKIDPKVDHTIKVTPLMKDQTLLAAVKSKSIRDLQKWYNEIKSK